MKRRGKKDTPAWVPFIEATRGKPGGQKDNTNAKREGEGTKCDDITLRSDNSSKPATGTSTSYAVRRLGKHRPDLLEKVKAG